MISGVLILTQGEGTVIYHRIYKQSDLKNIDLTAGLLTAIFQFSRQFGDEELNSISLQNSKFAFSASNKLLFILQLSHPDVPDTVTGDYLKKIQKIFFLTFGASWKETINDESLSLHFSEKLDEILEQQVTVTEIPLLVRFDLNELLLDLVHAPNAEDLESTVRELRGCFYRIFQDSDTRYVMEQLTSRPFVFYTRKDARFVLLIPYFLTKSSEMLMIGFTTPRENLYALHHLLPQITLRCDTIASKIGSFFRIIHQNKPLDAAIPEIMEENEDLRKELSEWVNLKRYVDSFALMLGEQLMKSGTIEDAITEERIQAEMRELLRVAGEDMDKLLYALLSHKKVVILGEREKVEPLVAIILNFIPIPSFLLWSETPASHALVGHPPSVDKKYLMDAVIVDLNSERILNGTSNKFCKQLLEETVQIGRFSPSDARIYLQTKLSAIYIVISQLIDGFHDPRESIQRNIEHLYLNREKDEREFILEITKELNPLLAWRLELLEKPKAKVRNFVKILRSRF